MAEVLLKNIRKIYPDGTKAVRGINLEIKDGEFMVLVGPSGCAKSTTLRMIAGLEDVTSGDLIIDERRVNDLPAAKRNNAMVFQDYALYPHMTAFDNIAYGLRIRKYTKSCINKKVREAAQLLRLEEELGKKPRDLSGGQRQRVAVGRVIVRDNPNIYLFDEPLSNLDAKLRVSMRAEIINIQKERGITMVYVTHDQVEAMTMGDRICVMNKGSIMQVDEPMKLYNNPANTFVATFIGSPEMNIIQGSIDFEEASIFFNTEGIRIKLPQAKKEDLRFYRQKEILLGIRPEHIKMTQSPSKERNLVRGEVFLIELMGHENNTHFNVGNEHIICRTSAHSAVEKGEMHSFVFDTTHCLLFDPDTKKNINRKEVEV